jgi:competence protein ComEA
MFMRSRTAPPRGQAAFLHYSTGYSLVKVSGLDGRDGVYQIFDGATASDVTKMTLTGLPGKPAVSQVAEGRLHNGDALYYAHDGAKLVLLQVGKMHLKELHLLGVPVKFQELSADDLQAIPGIGNALAKEIISYSQKNGGISSPEELLNVPGVGEGKLKKINDYLAGR